MNQGAPQAAALSTAELIDYLCTANGAPSSVERYVEIFGLRPAVLADQVAVYRRSQPDAARTSDVEVAQRFIADVLRVVLAVAENGIAIQPAITWFRFEPLSTFDQQTAEQLVSQGQVDQVLQFLASWQAGSQG
ncbi:hypothetical protein ABE484_04765 [Pseudomonas pudica]|uniref:hypothetical protein n=1 Tax=Pseudomonas pudica TaxID=272772 RepID=UPI00320AB4BA